MSFISFIYEKHGSFFSRGDGLFDCYETCFVYIQNVDVALSRRGNRRRVSNRAVCASYAVHRHGRRTDGVVSKGCGSRRNRRHEASERITHGIRNYGVNGVFGYMRSVVRTREQNFVFVLESKQFAAFFIMLPTLITSTLYASFRSWFWGRKKFVAFSSTELIDEIVKIILSIVFAGGFVGSLSGATGIALALTVSDAFCVLVLAIIFFATGGRFKKPQGFKELTRGTIPLSATRIITSLGASLTAFVIPQMLVKSGLTIAQATAEYGRVAGMALPLIMAPVTFIGALAIVLIPDVASLRSQGDTGALRTKLSTCVTFGTVVACFSFHCICRSARH